MKPRSCSFTRRPHLGFALLAACLLIAGTSRGETPRPNLLIIQTDEHNFRTLGCYRDTLSPEQALMWGEAVVETPHIDWIADHGASAPASMRRPRSARRRERRSSRDATRTTRRW